MSYNFANLLINHPQPRWSHSLWLAFRSVINRYHQHQENKDARLAFMGLYRLDDKLLDDLGVTREEVIWAQGLPLQVNASRALFSRARARQTQQKKSRRRATWPTPHRAAGEL